VRFPRGEVLSGFDDAFATCSPVANSSRSARLSNASTPIVTNIS